MNKKIFCSLPMIIGYVSFFIYGFVGRFFELPDFIQGFTLGLALSTFGYSLFKNRKYIKRMQ